MIEFHIKISELDNGYILYAMPCRDGVGTTPSPKRIYFKDFSEVESVIINFIKNDSEFKDMMKVKKTGTEIYEESLEANE